MGLHTEERRLYVLRGTDGSWRFVGEGPSGGRGKTGGNDGYHVFVNADLLWTDSFDAPVLIFLTTQVVDHDGYDGSGEIRPRRNLVKYRVGVLEGPLPAKSRWMTQRPYLMAESGDTFEKLVHHLGTWELDWSREEKRESILERIRLRLQGLNPEIPKGSISPGTRIYWSAR